MNKRTTSPLVLDAMLVTGNTKAAIKAAGGGSSDLWTVPPVALYYDPRDNVRPLDLAHVRHIADSIKANGYDRKKPIGCFVKKVAGEDRIHVYEGQHRYHGALLAISEGMEIERLPIVIDEAKSVSRANLIISGVINNDSEKLTPLDLASAILELQALELDAATIRTRLNVTDQTVRDVLLLASAPAGIHKLVRDKAVASTLAIEEIRKHGPEKAHDRLIAAAAEAKAAGKTKVTKKALPKPASDKITPVQAKQLLQALQSVFHDPVFGKLSPGTIRGVHSALAPHADLLDAKPAQARKYPINTTDEDGQYTNCEVLRAPPAKRTNRIPAEISLAQPQDGAWIYAFTLSISPSWGCVPLSTVDHSAIHPTRGQAIRAAVSELTRLMQHGERAKAKEAGIVNAWLDKLYTAPDPDWTEELAGGAQ